MNRVIIITLADYGFYVGPGDLSVQTHPLFELQPLLDGHRVRLRDDGNNVDRVTQALHELDVEQPKSGTEGRENRERAGE